MTSSSAGAGVKPDYALWGLLALALGLMGFIYFEGLALMVKWWEREEYSHGYMIPLVALFMIYQRQQDIPERVGRGSWLAVPALVLGVFMFYLGELSALYTIIQYGFLLSLYAIIAAFFGWRVTSFFWAALAYLIFMIPLPYFLYNNLSSQLQLISSSLGVAVIRLFDITVYLEGNVIDLGVYKLQVVEACSGLRYLFPLMSFGFLIAYLYRGPNWQKIVLFLSTIPITVLMNSFRIGVIGVTVEYWGIEMAEGFLHDFEGWVVFMGCLGVLLIEIWIFHAFSKQQMPMLERINLDLPARNISLSELKLDWRAQRPFHVCLVILLVVAASVQVLGSRQEEPLARESFGTFPLFHNGWRGRESALEKDVLDTLKLTDYLKATYAPMAGGMPVDFYVAYYDSQRKGASIHSPRSCIPGGGWELEGLGQRTLQGIPSREGGDLRVNRVIIKKGDSAQLTYYWFEQRHRNVTDEYLAKWFIFWDSMTMNRTDGALVRVIVPVEDAGKIEESDEYVQRFIRDFYPVLVNYMPSVEKTPVEH